MPRLFLREWLLCVTHAAAVVHIEDRGFQFADSVYEVISLIDGHFADGTGPSGPAGKISRERSVFRHADAAQIFAT